MQLFESLVGEKRDPCVRDDAQDGGSEASVQRLHTFLLGDPHKDVHDVAVPVSGGGNKTAVGWFQAQTQKSPRASAGSSHLFGRDCHPGSHRVQWVGQHGGGGAGQRTGQESWERRKSSGGRDSNWKFLKM